MNNNVIEFELLRVKSKENLNRSPVGGISAT
jgi:hypothetical protein